MPFDPLTGRFTPGPSRERERERGRLPVGAPDTGFGDNFKLIEELPLLDDLLLFAPRAAEGLVRSTGELVDLVPGVETNLSEHRFLGRSETLVGGFLETATQIAVPFSLAGKFSKGVGLLRSATGAASRAANLGAMRAGLTAAGGELGRFAVAGAVADFLAFGGQEERLSNLLAKAPGLQQPVFEFLQADEDDPELVGRIKNVLEGLGMGFLFDTVFGAIRGVKAARKVANEEGAKKAQEIFRAEIEERAPRAAQDLRKVEDRIEEAAQGEKKRARRATKKYTTDAQREAAERARRARAGRSIEEKVIKERLSLQEALDRGVENPAKVVTDELFTPEAVEQAAKAFDDIEGRNFGLTRFRLGGDPHLGKLPTGEALSKEAKALFKLSQDGINLRSFAGLLDDPSPITVIRALENVYQDAGLKVRRSKRTEQEILLSGEAILNDLINAGHSGDQAIEDLSRSIDRFVGKTEDIVPFVAALQTAKGAVAGQLRKLLGARRSILTEASPLQSGLTPSTIADLGLQRGSLDEVDDLILDQLRLLQQVHRGVVGGGENIGRALRTFGIPHTTDLYDLISEPIEGLAKRLKGRMGTEEFERMVGMLEVASGEGGLRAISTIDRLLAMSRSERFQAFSVDWFVSSLLNSPKTSVTNGIFPFAKAFWVPIENMIGAGVLRAVGQGAGTDGVFVRELATLGGMVQAMGEAARVSRQAFTRGGALLDPEAAFREDVGRNARLFSDEVFGAVVSERFGPGTLGGAVVNLFGQVNSLGTRGIAAADEFIKTMVARGYAKGMLQEQAMARGIDPTAHVADGMDRLFEGGRLLTSQRIEKKVTKALAQETFADRAAREARRTELRQRFRDEANFDELNPMSVSLLERARDITEQTPFDPQYEPLSLRTQEIINSFPPLKLVVPFFRTPVRLLKSAVQRSPLGLPLEIPAAFLQKARGGVDAIEASRFRNVREFFSSDPHKRAAAVGRVTTGLGVSTAAIWAANQGIITGAGPSDPERRRLLLDAGWLPYSYFDGESYTQYLRADPFSIMVGLTADVVETAKLSVGVDDQDENQAIMVGLVNSIAENIVNRTYLTGVRSFLDAITEPQRGAAPFIASTALGFVPKTFQQFGQFIDDPVLKDAYGVTERIRSRLPFFSQEVRPFRNVLGETVERISALSPAAAGAGPTDSPANLFFDFFVPIAYREVSDDVLRREFAALQHGFSPPQRKRFGVRLDSFRNARGRDAYDRWLELHGSVTIQGRTLRQELRRLIQTRQYQELPVGGSVSAESPRVRLLRGVIERYRARAFDRALSEFPELATEVSRNRREQARIRSGRSSPQQLDVQFPFRSFAELQR